MTEQKVPIHLAERRDWDQIAQRLRLLLDECVPQVMDRDYVTVGEGAGMIIEMLVQGVAKAHRQLRQGLVELAIGTLERELEEAPSYLRSAAEVSGRPASAIEDIEPAEGER